MVLWLVPCCCIQACTWSRLEHVWLPRRDNARTKGPTCATHGPLLSFNYVTSDFQTNQSLSWFFSGLCLILLLSNPFPRSSEVLYPLSNPILSQARPRPCRVAIWAPTAHASVERPPPAPSWVWLCLHPAEKFTCHCFISPAITPDNDQLSPGEPALGIKSPTQRMRQFPEEMWML